MKTHLLNMVLYAGLISALFSLFMRDGFRARLRFAIAMAGSMVGAAVVAAWVMVLVG